MRLNKLETAWVERWGLVPESENGETCSRCGAEIGDSVLLRTKTLPVSTWGGLCLDCSEEAWLECPARCRCFEPN